MLQLLYTLITPPSASAVELGTLRSDASYSKSNEAAVNSFDTSFAIEEGVEAGDHRATICDEEVLPDVKH